MITEQCSVNSGESTGQPINQLTNTPYIEKVKSVLKDSFYHGLLHAGKAMVMGPPVSWGVYLNSGEVGFGGPWVSAVSALVLDWKVRENLEVRK